MSQALTALGRQVGYADQYDASLLDPIARHTQREQLGLHPQQALPFMGGDLWTGYELSWLNPKGKPQVAVIQMLLPCETPFLIESKSLKLYLNSFNQTVFASSDEVRARLAQDLSRSAWGSETGQRLGIQLIAAHDFDQQRIEEMTGLNLDRLDVDCDLYTPHPAYLSVDKSQAPVHETLSSRLLKSNCPVTGQPDWASIQISYSGHPIDQAGLLRYIISFRQHQEFHEHCVERIFMDIMQRCQPTKLSVYARYTRRGGLDINPLRANYPSKIPINTRTARQ